MTYTELSEVLKSNHFTPQIEETIFMNGKHTFDGDFTLDPLISNEQDLEPSNRDLVKKIKQHLEKIRNVLVHIRESRENKVILPTEKNTDTLRPYLYLIQRIAEQVAINYE